MIKLHEQIIEIQTKIAFQEQTIEELNQVVIEQEKQIRQLQNNLKIMNSKLNDSIQQNTQSNPVNEIPPHY